MVAPLARTDRHDDQAVAVIRVCAWIAAGLASGVALDMFVVWIWLSFIHDGHEFPY